MYSGVGDAGGTAQQAAADAGVWGLAAAFAAGAVVSGGVWCRPWLRMMRVEGVDVGCPRWWVGWLGA